ncbi:MAG: hypothetical protein VYA18_15575, partial [Pseudomonadota bacterium]|nr:hypothetical protein [Pseudomonadota bacterium]
VFGSLAPVRAGLAAHELRRVLLDHGIVLYNTYRDGRHTFFGNDDASSRCDYIGGPKSLLPNVVTANVMYQAGRQMQLNMTQAEGPLAHDPKTGLQVS